LIVKRRERDWSHYDLVEGPPILREDEHLPLGDVIQMSYGPYPIDAAISAKKEIEAKKNAEKEAKMKKFLEKQAATKKLAETAAKSEAKPKEKPDKGKPKDQGPTVDELLKVIEALPPGSKKPTDVKLPDAYEPRYVEAGWYSWWMAQGFFKPEYGLVSTRYNLSCQIKKYGYIFQIYSCNSY